MARLIDADKIVNGIALYMTENAYLNDTPLDALKMVANWITDAPTVDAVEVVRCRECHCYTPVDKRIGKCVFMIGEHQYVVPNGYCYLGERKDGDGDGLH